MKVESSSVAKSCVVITAAAALLLSYLFWGQWVVLIAVWCSAIPMIFVLAFAIGMACSLLDIEVNDSAEDEDFEDEDFVFSEENFKHSGEIIGKYMDVPIWSSIILNVSGKDMTLLWDSVVHPLDEITAPEDRYFAIVEPGLLYIEPESSIANA